MTITRPPPLTTTLLLGAGALFLAWRIVVVNLAELHFQAEDERASARALRWQDIHPGALYREGLRLVERDPKGAHQRFRSAIAGNPADGPSYSAIADILQARGDAAGAAKAIESAAGMAPQRVEVQTAAAGFWMRRGDPGRAMKHLDIALTYDGALRQNVFPGLLEIAETPASRTAAFSEILKQPVAWWPEVLTYAAAKASRTDTVRGLAELAAAGPNRTPPQALRAYLERLQREGLWVEAYIAWLNSLGKDKLRAIGNLYNGDFEDPLSNIGFDWVVTPASQVVIETAGTYGTTGHKALRILFRGPRIQFRNLHQHMMLDPGNYTLRGKVRPESLETPQGIRWAIYCPGQAEPLAASEPFRGTDHWRHFTVRFEVPAKGCIVQTIRLELMGRAALDFEARGVVWFDDLAVGRQRLD